MGSEVSKLEGVILVLDRANNLVLMHVWIFLLSIPTKMRFSVWDRDFVNIF